MILKIANSLVMDCFAAGAKAAAEPRRARAEEQYTFILKDLKLGLVVWSVTFGICFELSFGDVTMLVLL